ncbi:HAD-IA family hydrolase [Desulfosporosinus sp. FKB]|uniref:HAD-IA family hydrolase n=1 Tax=Desulfosporosinus sp. FKB TaxID=1969835 RepID=UPI000B4A255F|nr:HAD-IA family hydrolase [Desulfosporosinus sp. FKB]
MVKLLVFDFDGTLVDSQSISIKIYNQLADKYHVKKIKSFDTIKKLPLHERFKALNLPVYKLPLFAADFTKQYKHSLETIALVTGMREILIELKKKGYELAIVSSNSESNIRDYLGEKQLNVFETIINSHNILGKDKVIKKLLISKMLEASEVLYVGDEIRDVIACKKLGIKIIWANWGYDLLEMLQGEQPDYIAYSPEDILSIINLQ